VLFPLFVALPYLPPTGPITFQPKLYLIATGSLRQKHGRVLLKSNDQRNFSSL
jgi:hypothetical protein